jgi:hypothetical protein
MRPSLEQGALLNLLACLARVGRCVAKNYMLDCPTFSAGLPERFPSACWTARVLAGRNARTIGQRTLEQTEGRLHRLILTTSH